MLPSSQFWMSMNKTGAKEMNRSLTTIAALTLSLAAIPLFAASNETDFLQLREKRDEALANAAKPMP